MRSFISTAAAGTALLAGAVTADLCSQGSAFILGNSYCQAVNVIQYQNFAAKGSYNRVTNMDPNTGSCSSEPFGVSGSMAPLNEDVSLHFRGPFHLNQFAYYKPGSAATKRTPHQKRHGHRNFHAHGARDNNSNEEKRDVGDWVVQTMNGEVVSWKNQYSGAAPTAPVAAANGVVNSVVAAATGAAAPVGKPFNPSYNGDWVRAGHYLAKTGESEGLTFLNNNGGSGSGTFDYKFGNSLSYASSDASTGSATSQVLDDMTIPSNTELILMSDKPCSHGSCGYVRPGTTAYHGFDNENAVYLFDFSMPDDGESSGLNPNMPALWMLNAQIPRTLQYGDSSCSCWESGCGEFDICEVLDSGNSRCKSTLHGIVSGGDSDYLDRPTGGSIKMAVVMSDSMATIKVLSNDYDFSKTLTNEDIHKLGSHKSGGVLEQLGSSLFNLASMGTSGIDSPF